MNLFEDVMRSALLCLILFFPLMVSCSSYKMDIRQGNYLTADMRDKLKLGLSRQQVRSVLGTPMINDVFHANRWDYVYLLEHEGKLVEQHRLTLYFEGDNLARMEDVTPIQPAATRSEEKNNVTN
jgi:outer membrane protein assembly factor BamE